MNALETAKKQLDLLAEKKDDLLLRLKMITILKTSLAKVQRQ